MEPIHNNSSVQLFMLRGAYGYMGFTEKIEGTENMYRVDIQGFEEALNSSEPLDASKVSSLSDNQLSVLQRSPSSSWMIPLLNKMGSLGMIDLREDLFNPRHIPHVQRVQASQAYENAL